MACGVTPASRGASEKDGRWWVDIWRVISLLLPDPFLNSLGWRTLVSSAFLTRTSCCKKPMYMTFVLSNPKALPVLCSICLAFGRDHLYLLEARQPPVVPKTLLSPGPPPHACVSKPVTLESHPCPLLNSNQLLLSKSQEETGKEKKTEPVHKQDPRPAPTRPTMGFED